MYGCFTGKRGRVYVTHISLLFFNSYSIKWFKLEKKDKDYCIRVWLAKIKKAT